MNRKQRRAMKRELKKQEGVDDAMAEKMMLFDELPDECSRWHYHGTLLSVRKKRQ